jgi:hypothetical protein
MSAIFRAFGLAAVAILLLLSAGSAQTETAGDPYDTADVTDPTPYWGYTRFAAYLHGLADLTRATGTYHIRIQKAAQVREKTRQMKLETRRLELQQIRWERNFIWDMRQEEIERTIQYEEERARKRAPLTEILAGTSLNWLLGELKLDPDLLQRQSQPIEQVWLANISLVSTGGNAGMLRQKHLVWPALLQEEQFAESRQRVESLLEQARQDARKSKLSGQTVKDLLAAHRQLEEGITEEATREGSPWGPTHQVLALRFLRELKRAMLLLQNPQEANFLLEHVPRCGTVAELIGHMSKHGLKFGPASAGCERHYVALHSAFARESEARQRSKK